MRMCRTGYPAGHGLGSMTRRTSVTARPRCCASGWSTRSASCRPRRTPSVPGTCFSSSVISGRGARSSPGRRRRHGSRPARSAEHLGTVPKLSWRAGDAAAARDQLAALLPIQERIRGPEHPETLATRHSLAAWKGSAGDAAVARDELAAVLPIMERLLGPEHPETLSTRRDFALWTGEAGDAAGARDQFATLLSFTEQLLGPEHPDPPPRRSREKAGRSCWSPARCSRAGRRSGLPRNRRGAWRHCRPSRSGS